MDKNTFLERVVFGWIKKDFERMLTIRPIDGGDGNINFPLALCALVDIEYLGGFLLGSDCGFDKNTGEYIRKCFKRPNEYKIEILRDIFRNGLAHEYFARAGVSRDGGIPALFIDKNNRVILDAETLVNDFLESLKKFKEELSEEKYMKRMIEAEETIKQKMTEHKELIGILPQKSDISITCSSSDVGGSQTTTYDPGMNP